MKNYVSILNKEISGYLVLLLIACFTNGYAQKKHDLSLYYNYLNSADTPGIEKKEAMMASYVYRINAGGWETGDGWFADSYADPSIYVNYGQIGYNSANGGGSGWDGIYSNKSRVNMSSFDMEWDFPVANGNYIVNLYFVENISTSQSIGSRVFDVEIEGMKALENFDILKHTGTDFVARLPFSVAVTDGNIDINFITEVGSSLITAIEIEAGSIINYPITSFNAYGLNFTMNEGQELRVPFIFSDIDSAPSQIEVFGEFYDGGTETFYIVDNGDGSGEIVFQAGYSDSSIGHYLIFGADDENGSVTDCPACWAAGTLTVINTPIGNAVYRVNAGDWSEVSGPAVNWSVDTYSKPSTYVNSTAIGFTTASHTVMSNPTDAPSGVFFKSRVDNSFNDMAWEFPLPDGNYIAKLYFVESNFNMPGQRVFDVAVEGAVELSYFDILSETAKNVPLQKNITTNVTDGSLSIVFEDRVANPIIAAIEVTYNGPVVVPPVAPELDLDASNANKQLLREVSVKPNPVQDRMTVVLPEAIKGEVNIRLFDSNNQVRYQSADASSFEREEVQFYISQQIPPGVYYAEISDGVSKYYVKVLKQ
ncbi:hypothetical protein LVD17_16200 [Fulvivirga ulvae]|uniref:malectin domain-containing carbohydrate-binding protein n=1 Tax=Fulvivirga ulvae TaxID=2904245 RepID=UPI001EED41EE|nr:malectin domain-containing carbohydrate-binding protein [Fulvivirga ulvae]UII29842.1 hypothetical protein LVD17_16200 [Fulvivirga ulvae]